MCLHYLCSGINLRKKNVIIKCGFFSKQFHICQDNHVEMNDVVNRNTGCLNNSERVREQII